MIIHNVHGSKLGNMMMKYMTARKLADMIGECKLSNYNMSEWNIEHCAVPTRSDEVTVELTSSDNEMVINFERALHLARSGIVDRFDLSGHLQRIENFGNLQDCREMFKAPSELGSYHRGCIVCPVRGAEILSAIHPGYTLLPISFYKHIFFSTGLKPFFIGQIGDDDYSKALLRSFPDAIFLPNRGALEDFQTIRKADAIVVSVSTFSWLAAWLSNAETIFLPHYGLFNRRQFPKHDLLPLGDKRYEFYDFPIHNAVDVSQFANAHENLVWRPVSHKELFTQPYI
jgi:hypothetical protein